jgi:hypothetical protein
MSEAELIEPPTSAVDIGELVKIYLTIRSEREKVQSEWEAVDQEFKNELSMIEQSLMVVCNESNAKSIRTDFGTVYRRLSERYTVADGDLFRKFVMENNAPELFEQRIAQSHFKEFIAERKEESLPPGVNVMREFTIVVRKPS